MVYENGVLTLNLITSVALGVLLLLIGKWLSNKVSFFRNYCIPAPVIGGFGFAIAVWILNGANITITIDKTLGDLFMFIFFVTIGIGGSFALIKKGGKLLFYYLLICWGLAIFQNGLGVALASLLGIDPLLGIASGAAALEGGHGMVAAMAPFIEESGGTGALTVGMAAATYGLVAGSLIGGPLGNWLIKRNNLKIETDEGWNRSLDASEGIKIEDQITVRNVFTLIAVIIIVLGVGTNVARWITDATGFTVPGHVFSLFLGLLFASINSKKQFVEMNRKGIEIISVISLELFLTMAMMNLKIWELYDLALPLIIILLVQTVCIILIAWLVVFRFTGKNYDAALLSAGFIGHGLGATANGLAVMDSITNKYGVISRKAFFIIPVSGSMLIDLVGVPSIVIFTNIFAP
ncbi:sodium/glutamate symporter [Ureibacillus manganicus]|uniref:Sodium/glutamate symporter n=1 Tax=Ureibacillus manganicus DSM 26584 TaxID=1384049 RepID=A0A0A3I273_9BACL|nr:sodium/glutamate symporter [Ureibacillus manganicus]KGR77615.1 sodium:glutamate symporter [Ureibacillus manganicus DSM 26584]